MKVFYNIGIYINMKIQRILLLRYPFVCILMMGINIQKIISSVDVCIAAFTSIRTNLSHKTIIIIQRKDYSFLHKFPNYQPLKFVVKGKGNSWIDV